MGSVSGYRVLLITARADYGGGPEYVYRLMSKLNDKVEFFAACPDDRPYMERYSGLIGRNKILTIPHRKFDLNSFINLIKFVKQNKIDLIHSHGKGAGIYSRPAAIITGRKCIHTFHGLHTGEYSALGKTLYLLLEKIFALMTSKLIAVSDSEKERLIDNGIATAEKIEVINNGVDTDMDIASSPDYGKPLEIVTVTRFDFAKNSGLAVDILMELKKKNYLDKFFLIFIGDGEERYDVEKKINEAGLAKFVRFTGFSDNVKQYYKYAFCYLSTSRWEGMPLSVLEAMSCGVPVVASNVTGNRDVVIHGRTGFIYDSEEPDEAAGYLITLAEDRNLWKKLSEEAIKQCKENFSFNLTAESNLTLYKYILDK